MYILKRLWDGLPLWEAERTPKEYGEEYSLPERTKEWPACDKKKSKEQKNQKKEAKNALKKQNDIQRISVMHDGTFGNIYFHTMLPAMRGIMRNISC